MSSLIISFVAAIAYVQSKTFTASSVLGGAADLEIDIGASKTTVTLSLSVTIPAPGYGLAFDTINMFGSPYALLVDISLSGVSFREVTLRTSSRGFDEISGADNWSLDSYDSNNYIIVISRDNDVSSSCSSCYTFSSSQTSLDIAYAESVGSVGVSSEFTNHGGSSGEYGGQTLNAPTDDPTTAKPTTATPSMNPTTGTPTTAKPTLPPGVTADPTSDPSMDPTTAMPTTSMPTEADDDEYETCVESTEIVTGVKVEIGRKTSDETLEITITGELNKYSAVGFGAEAMDGTYAIIVDGEGTSDVMERKLGNHVAGSEITGDDRSFSSAESNTNDGTTQTVVIRRKYSSGDTYDFTDLLTCEVDAIDAISAQGSSYNFIQHAKKGIGSLERICDCEDTPTPESDSANNFFDAFYICLILVLSFYFLF